MHVVSNMFIPLNCFFDLPNYGLSPNIFRMYNPSDEVQLVKTLPAQYCWKVGRFLKRPLVVTLSYSEAVIVTERTNDGMDVLQKCCLSIKDLSKS